MSNDDGSFQMYPVLIEQTAKKIKRVQMIGVLVMLPSLLVILFGMFMLYNGNRLAQDWGAILIYASLLPMVLGIIIGIYAWCLAWWYHR